MGKLSLKDSSWSLEVKKTECSLKPAHLIPWAPPVSLLLIPVKQFERAVVAVAHGGMYQKRHLESQSTELSSHVSDAEKGGITFDWVWEKDSLALTMLNLRVSKYPKERGRSTDFQFKSKKSGSVLYGSGNRWHPSHSWSKEKECTLGKNARWSEERNVGRILGSSVLTVWGGGDGERVARCWEESEQIWKGECFKGKRIIRIHCREVVNCGSSECVSDLCEHGLGTALKQRVCNHFVLGWDEPVKALPSADYFFKKLAVTGKRIGGRRWVIEREIGMDTEKWDGVWTKTAEEEGNIDYT